MLLSFADETVAVVRPPMIDDHGALVPDYAGVEDEAGTPVPGCLVVPGPSTENNTSGDWAQIAGTCYMPPGTDVTAGDLLRVDGVLYRVEGDPARWRSATGTVDHVAVEYTTWGKVT